MVINPQCGNKIWGMTIAIASDHAGFEIKQALIEHLNSKGIKTENFGPNSTDSMDYPDTAHPAALSVENGEHELGILLCGSGNGISMTANKHQGIRAALCWQSDIATLARQHNNANICVLPARYVSLDLAIEIVDAFLSAKFEGGRHQLRIDKIPV